MNPYIAVSIAVVVLVICLLLDALFGGDKKPPEDLLSWRKDDGIEIGEPDIRPETKRPIVTGYSRRTEAEHALIRELIKVNPKDCTHQKGGRTQSRYKKDYNVSLFTFIDGTRRVRCLTCGQKWFEGDKGWDEALRMATQSTNAQASSERPAYFKIENLFKGRRKKDEKRPDRKWFRR
jgi:hypothetical protein